MCNEALAVISAHASTHKSEAVFFIFQLRDTIFTYEIAAFLSVSFVWTYHVLLRCVPVCNWGNGRRIFLHFIFFNFIFFNTRKEKKNKLRCPPPAGWQETAKKSSSLLCYYIQCSWNIFVSFFKRNNNYFLFFHLFFFFFFFFALYIIMSFRSCFIDELQCVQQRIKGLHNRHAGLNPSGFFVSCFFFFRQKKFFFFLVFLSWSIHSNKAPTFFFHVVESQKGGTSPRSRFLGSPSFSFF